MPELPEVETYRRYFEETSLYQPISDVYVQDTKVIWSFMGAQTTAKEVSSN